MASYSKFNDSLSDNFLAFVTNWGRIHLSTPSIVVLLLDLDCASLYVVSEELNIKYVPSVRFVYDQRLMRVYEGHQRLQALVAKSSPSSR
jgi:ribosome-binding factor A